MQLFISVNYLTGVLFSVGFKSFCRIYFSFCRAKELAPEHGGGKGKKVIDLDYNEEDSDNENEDDDDDVRPLSNSNSHYRNVELAMLCTKSVRSFLHFNLQCVYHSINSFFMLIFNTILFYTFICFPLNRF